MNIRVKLYNPNYKPGKKEYILGTLCQSIDYGGDKQYFGIQVDDMRCDYNKGGLFWFRKDQLRIERDERGGDKIMEILGHDLGKFFDLVDPEYTDAVLQYHSDTYQVWEITKRVHDIMCKLTDEQFSAMAGEDAWWRSATGCVLGVPGTEYEVNGEGLIGWESPIYDDYDRTKFSKLTEYLCRCIGASTEKNVCACCVGLAKYNNITMAELFEKYEGR